MHRLRPADVLAAQQAVAGEVKATRTFTQKIRPTPMLDQRQVGEGQIHAFGWCQCPLESAGLSILPMGQLRCWLSLQKALWVWQVRASSGVSLASTLHMNGKTSPGGKRSTHIACTQVTHVACIGKSVEQNDENVQCHEPVCMCLRKTGETRGTKRAMLTWETVMSGATSAGVVHVGRHGQA